MSVQKDLVMNQSVANRYLNKKVKKNLNTLTISNMHNQQLTNNLGGRDPIGHYVYAHYRASDRSIMYVGKGSKGRWKDIKKRNSDWNNQVKFHGLYDRVYIVQENLTSKKAFKLEEVVELMVENSQCLTNQLRCGTGGIGISLRKIVAQYTLKGIYVNKYVSHAEASRQTGIHQTAITNCTLGNYKHAGGYMWISIPDEEKIPERIPAYIKISKRRLKVVQYSLDGVLHAVYESMTEASKQNGICLAQISMCTAGKNISAGGFQWIRIPDGEKIPERIPAYIKPKIHNIVKIRVKNRKTGEFIGEYESMCECARQLNINEGTIYFYLKGKPKNPRSHHYHFEYADKQKKIILLNNNIISGSLYII